MVRIRRCRTLPRRAESAGAFTPSIADWERSSPFGKHAPPAPPRPEWFDETIRFDVGDMYSDAEDYSRWLSSLDESSFAKMSEGLDDMCATECVKAQHRVALDFANLHLEATDLEIRKRRNPRHRRRFNLTSQVMTGSVRAIALGQVSTLTVDEWRRILSAFDGRCAYCDDDGPMTLDHVIALSKGGNHSAGNVVPACFSCNSSKHANDMVDWLDSRGAKWSAILDRIERARLEAGVA